MPYGYIGSMKTQQGKREEVVAIMLSGLDGLQKAGCIQYAVGVSLSDDVTICTSEVWVSKELGLLRSIGDHVARMGPPRIRARSVNRWSEELRVR
jgi:quinol monooxygenase YgiN